MSNIAYLMAVVLSLAVGGCAGYASAEQSGADIGTHRKDFTVADVGRNAAIVLAIDINAQELLRQNKIEEAVRTLESSYLYQISLLREFDRELGGDERHVRLRDRVVLKLKRMWLDNPPEYLDSASAAFLEMTCTKIPGCPPGKVRGRKELPAGPR